MNYNSNFIYNNYMPKNTTKKPYQTQPNSFYPPPSKNSYNDKNNQYNPYLNGSQNFGSSNGSNYNQQNLYSPHSKNSLKWRNIMKIDLPLLQNSRDLNLIQTHLENLVFGDISEEDIQTLPEVNIVKLIQILQTSCDILLYEQQDLENERDKLEKENIQQINKFKHKEKKINSNKDKISHLKKAKKRDISVLETYQNAINNLQNGNNFNIKHIKEKITETNINRENEEQNQNLKSQKGAFKCQYCPDITFMTEFERDKHLNEVHGINQLSPQIHQSQPQIDFQPQIKIELPPELFGNNNAPENDMRGDELLKRMDDMKNDFISKLEEKKSEEERQSNVRSNYGDITDGFQKGFKDTLNDFKLMIEQNNDINNESNDSEENEEFNEEYYKNLKMNEMNRLKKELEDINEKIENQKINYEKEIEEIKIKQININKKYQEDENIKNSYSNVIKKQIEYQKIPRIIQKSNEKKYFNSGKLVSDHDDSDEERRNLRKAIESYNNERDIISKITKKKRILQDIQPNTIDQSNFFKNDDEDGIKEMGYEYDNKNILKDEKNMKKIVKKNEKLEHYYRKYKKRDDNYLDDPKEENYLIETLPKKFDLNPHTNDTASHLMKDKVNKTGIKLFPDNLNMNKIVDEEELKKENVDDLVMLVNSLINNMNGKNLNKNGNEYIYYSSIKELLDLDKNVKKAKEAYNKHRDNNDTIINEIKYEFDKNKMNGTKNNKENTEINNIDKDKDKNETGIIINEIKDQDNEDILDDIDKTKKLKNKQDNIKNVNKPSSNQNIKHNIYELNKKSNMTILETTQINQNNDNNLNPNIQNNIEQPKDKRNDAHLDTHYTSSNINKGNQINNQINTNNKMGLDVPYTSTAAANQINLDNNNLDSGYSSAKNAASPINNNIEGNKINFNQDTNYISTKMAGIPINNDSNNNVDPGYSSARIGEMQANNNNNQKDPGNSSDKIGGIQINNNNDNNDLNSGYSSARHGVSPTDNNNTQINYNNNNQINANNNINNHQDTGYSSATMGAPQTNYDITNQVNNNNHDVSYNSNMANINNIQAAGQNAITELKTNENNQIKEEENYSGEFDK